MKVSFGYRVLMLFGLNYSETEYGNVSIFGIVKKVWITYRNSFLVKFLMNSFLFEPLSPRKLRPWVLKKIGCTVGRNVFIGAYVYIDTGYSNLIILEENAHVASRCLLLCHQRDLTNYCVGDDYAKLPYRTGVIHIRKGALIGMNTTIMPGVTIGEGAIVGAHSLVTKDIPAWTIATGVPAKVVKQVRTRESEI
jgi:acetyltransferase-like isoleucine patch superfamily enzyme